MQSIRGARRRERSRRASAIAGSLARARRFATEVRPEPRKQRRKIDGQALAEFALILPVFLFLLLMAVDFGRVFFTYIQLNNAAREAAAYAAGQVGGETYSSTHVLAYAQQETNTQGQVGPGGVTIQVSCATPSGSTLDCTSPDVQGAGGIGNTVTVSVHQDFNFLTPFIGDVFGAPLTMTASSTAAINGQISGKGTAPGTCGTNPIAHITQPIDVSGLTANLDASLSTPLSGVCAITGYTWEISDGTVLQDPSDIHVSHAFAAPGTYHVVLTVTNPAGQGTDQTDVTVGSGPTASPSPTPTPTPQPTPTVINTNPTCNTMPGFTWQFTGTGTGQNAHRMTFYGSYTGQPAPASWAWSFGENGSSGSGVTASNKYKNAGTYTVTLTVTNGTCSHSVSQVVVVP